MGTFSRTLPGSVMPYCEVEWRKRAVLLVLSGLDEPEGIHLFLKSTTSNSNRSSSNVRPFGVNKEEIRGHCHHAGLAFKGDHWFLAKCYLSGRKNK